VLNLKKIALQVEQLGECGDCVVACSNFRTIDEDGLVLSDRYFPKEYRFPDDPFSAILHGSQGLKIVIHSPTALVRRSGIEAAGGYPEDLIQEDFFMWLSLASRGGVAFSNETLVDYRITSGSLSARLQGSWDNRIRYLCEHIRVIDRFLDTHIGGRHKSLLRAKVARLSRLEWVMIDGAILFDEFGNSLSDIVKMKNDIASDDKGLREVVAESNRSAIIRYLRRFGTHHPASSEILRNLGISIRFGYFLRYVLIRIMRPWFS
jgi:hypothetical protein